MESSMAVTGRGEEPKNLCSTGKNDASVTSVLRADTVMDYPIFLHASADSVLKFDVFELTGRGLADHVSWAEHEGYACPADIHVPAASRLVTIPKHAILRQMICILNIKIYGFGLVIESPGQHRGWIDIDIPGYSIGGMQERKKFYGEAFKCRCDAMDDVSGAVIDRLSEAHYVVVGDVNFGTVVGLRKKLHDAELWRYLMTATVQEEKKLEDDEGKKKSELCKDLAGLCRQFSDVLPIEIHEAGGNSNESQKIAAVYAGSCPPVTRLEKFACHVVGLISGASRVDA